MTMTNQQWIALILSCFLLSQLFASVAIILDYFCCSERPAERPPEPTASVVHSLEAFKLNYAEMENHFKIFVYPEEGFVGGGKYTSEGYFFKNIKESGFLTNDPEKANLFFIPLSCYEMSRKGLSYDNMTRNVKDYVQSLMVKYPFLNRTLGTGHFFLTCHDIGLKATVGVPHLVKNSIRVVCASGDDDGYIPRKDLTLLQIMQPFALPAARFDPENRDIRTFWPVYTGNAISLEKYYNRSKFCIFPGLSHVHGARIALSIHHGCVPVILSDKHDLPFNDILDWNKFSIIIKVDDIERLKLILGRISNEEFRYLHYNTVQ
ncbi:Exostosin, partial [Theobroma cacao]